MDIPKLYFINDLKIPHVVLSLIQYFIGINMLLNSLESVPGHEILRQFVWCMAALSSKTWVAT